MFIFIFVPVFMVVVFGFVIWTIVKAIKQNIANKKAPLNQRWARVSSKRTYESSGEYSHTTYYVTFEEQTGQRYEWTVSGKWYGQVAQGDIGWLTTQGTAFRSFDRQVNAEPSAQ